MKNLVNDQVFMSKPSQRLGSEIAALNATRFSNLHETSSIAWSATRFSELNETEMSVLNETNVTDQRDQMTRNLVNDQVSEKKSSQRQGFPKPI